MEVVFCQRGYEDDGGHVLKTMDPLSPLWPLTSNIHKTEVDLNKLEKGLLQHRDNFIESSKKSNAENLSKQAQDA